MLIIYRLHLQHLGHPIANDPIYANPKFTCAGVATNEELIARIEHMEEPIRATTLEDQTNASSREANITPVHGLENAEMREMWSGEVCDICGTQLYIDPPLGDLEIWLHAWKYSGRSVPTVEGQEGELWSYESKVPDWGQQDWHGSPRSRSRNTSALQR